jgi:hypothetical protein
MTFSINETRPHLELETGSLSASELSMGTLMREINLRNKPSRILQMLMGHLENKRMEKKLGWSRPWNKVGVTTFRTHKIRIQEDTRFLEKIRKTLMPVLVQIGENYLNFAREFLSDPNLMAFVFYHNRQQGLDWYEGVTLSFGRRVPSDRNKRDRIDLILEDKRENGKVDNLPDRIRIIVNPFSNWLKDEVSLSEFAHREEAGTVWDGLFNESVKLYGTWKDEPDRQWEHWAIRYIDYFGPRGSIPVGSSFT